MPDPSSSDPDNFTRRIPEGDDRRRLVCNDCGFIQYENPQIVVGSVASWGDRILLCRRAIPPRKGYWTLPAGYLELGESAEAGAMREAWEEARAHLEIDQLLAVYSIPRISQVQLIFRARLQNPEVEPGPESQEVGLFRFDQIPVEEIAFPSVHWALRDYQETMDQAIFAPRMSPVQQRPVTALPGEQNRC
ncbi:NUDIX domain-containing protein [Thioalkalivibrio sp.]|uniref:NUDIX hydrolase n=1 Tax=Thioalkalivibrio sp. TaxID=2093813 RepID=UPI0039762286